MPTELPLAAAKPDELSVIAEYENRQRYRIQRDASPGGAAGKDIFAPLRAMKLHNIQPPKAIAISRGGDHVTLGELAVQVLTGVATTEMVACRSNLQRVLEALRGRTNEESADLQSGIRLRLRQLGNRCFDVRNRGGAHGSDRGCLMGRHTQRAVRRGRSLSYQGIVNVHRLHEAEPGH